MSDLSISQIVSPALQPTVGSIVARMERIPPTRLHLTARIIMGTATFFDAFDMLAISSMLPVLVGLLASNRQQHWLYHCSCFTGQVIGALVFTRLPDFWPSGCGAIQHFAVRGHGLMCAFGWDFTSLCVFRFIQGIGLGSECPLRRPISTMSRAKRRGRFVLVYELGFPIGIVASTIVGSWLVPSFGWQSMYIVGALPALLVIVLRRNLRNLHGGSPAGDVIRRPTVSLHCSSGRQASKRSLRRSKSATLLTKSLRFRGSTYCGRHI